MFPQFGTIWEYLWNTDEPGGTIGHVHTTSAVMHDVLCLQDYPRNRHPGWSRGSAAYHAGQTFPSFPPQAAEARVDAAAETARTRAPLSGPR